MSSELVTELYRSFYEIDTNLWNHLTRSIPERLDNSLYSRSSSRADVTQIKDIVESYCYDYKLPSETN
jgi:hypothetical protein